MLNYFSDIAVKKESREMLKLAIPAAIGQLAQMSMGAIDTVMAGNLNTEALAAISVGSNLFMPLFVFAMGLFMSLNPLVAQANGAQRFNKLGDYLRQGLYLAIFISIPCIYIVNELEPVMIQIGVQSSIIPIVTGYLFAISWGILPLFLFLALRSVNEGLFSNKVIMIVAISAIPLNIILNNIFMYGYGSIPAMGAVGLGYATSLVWIFLFLVLLAYMVLTPKYKHIEFFTHFHKPNLLVFKEILKLGIPLSLTIGLEVMMFAAVGLFIGRFSIDVIAAHQIASNYSGLVFMVPLGLSIAVTARVGHAVGRKSLADVQRAVIIGFVYAVIFMLSAITLSVTLTHEIVSIYTIESKVVEQAVKLLLLAAVFMLCDGIQVTASGSLSGLKDTVIPMFLAGISYWVVGFPLGYFLAEAYGMQAEGYWIGFIAGLSTAALLLSIRLIRLIQQYKSGRITL